MKTSLFGCLGSQSAEGVGEVAGISDKAFEMTADSAAAFAILVLPGISNATTFCGLTSTYFLHHLTCSGVR